jgi:sugar lactone lactonase YvrE
MRNYFVVFAVLGALLPGPARAQVPSFLAQWSAPRAVGITFDPAGNVYVAELSNYPTHIDVHAPDGTLLASWGKDGSDASSVTGPYYIAADANGHLFVAEWTIHNVSQFPLQEFTTSGSFIAGVGYYSSSPSSAPGAITGVGGVAVGPDGRIYVTDEGNPRTQVFANDRTFLFQWPSQGNSIAIDAFGHAFEVEEGGVVRKYDTNSGAELTRWGSYGSGPGQFNSPQGVAVDSAGNVYVTDTYNHRVEVFDNNGAFLMQWGDYGIAPGQFYRPMGIGVGPDGKIYVGDTWNGRVQIFGSLLTPTKSPSWGHIKALYR